MVNMRPLHETHKVWPHLDQQIGGLGLSVSDSGPASHLPRIAQSLQGGSIAQLKLYTQPDTQE